MIWFFYIGAFIEGLIIVLLILWFIRAASVVLNNQPKGNYIDNKGYWRNKHGKLIHRLVAYRHVYDYPHTHKKRFSEYEVHHIDRNKRNNHPKNLQVLTPAQHRKIHGK